MLRMPPWYPDWDCIFNAMLLTTSWYLNWDRFLCNALLLIPAWYLDGDCILQCYAAYTILISGLRLFFFRNNTIKTNKEKAAVMDIYMETGPRSKMHYYLKQQTTKTKIATHNFDILIFGCCSVRPSARWRECCCNAMLPKPSWYLDLNCILQCYAAYAISISRLRLYFAMLCCLRHLNISTETVFCNAMLLTPSWYLDWDLFSKLCCVHHLDISTETVFCNAMLLTSSRYLDWDCILQCYAAYAILISQLRLYFAMLCC